jgi:hypothetical protein
MRGQSGIVPAFVFETCIFVRVVISLQIFKYAYIDVDYLLKSVSRREDRCQKIFTSAF